MRIHRKDAIVFLSYAGKGMPFNFTHRPGRQRANTGRARSFEALEGRAMPASTAIGVDLFADNGSGSPGAAISADSLEPGESFFAEITVDEMDSAFHGLSAVALNVSWNPAVLAIDGPFSPSSVITSNLPLFQSGTLSASSGQIENLSGASFLAFHIGAAIGNQAPQEFALLHFEALAAGISQVMLDQGGSGIATVPTTAVADSAIDFTSPTITVAAPSAGPLVVPVATVTAAAPAGSATSTADTPPALTTPIQPPPPEIAITGTSDATDGMIQFTTARGAGSTASVSTLVRPALPDTKQYIDVTNTGGSSLIISQIEINAPDVTTDAPAMTGAASDLVLAPGQTQQIRLTYAPSVPNSQNSSTESFNLSSGLVIVSNAANTPQLPVGLAGASTYNADVNYDGQVNIADVLVIASEMGAHAGQARYDRSADPNADGSIDLADFGLVNAEFGAARTAPVPALLSGPPIAAAASVTTPVVVATVTTVVSPIDSPPLAVSTVGPRITAAAADALFAKLSPNPKCYDGLARGLANSLASRRASAA
jgi:hypothetical protein